MSSAANESSPIDSFDQTSNQSTQLPHRTITQDSTSPAANPSSISQRGRTTQSKKRRYLAFALLSLAVSLLAIMISLNQSPDAACPYGDVLGLQSANQPINHSNDHSTKKSAMPPAHVKMPGLTEADCPHLAKHKAHQPTELSFDELMHFDLDQHTNHVEVVAENAE